MLNLFGRGLLIGMAIAAPVGPIGVLCIRHTLSNGRMTGLVAGLGAATADGIYGSIAGLGLSTIADALEKQQHVLGLGGGLFLCYLGVNTAMSQATALVSQHVTDDHTLVTDDNVTGDDGLASQMMSPRHSYPFFLKTYLSTLALTLTNPATILSFTAIFAGVGIANEHSHHLASLALVVGVFLGSALWWLLLSSGISMVRDRLSAIPLTWINRISGIIIISFGLVAIFTQF